MCKKRKTINLTLITYIFTIVASVLGIALNFVMARIMQAEKYGYIQYSISLYTTISSLIIFGFSNYIIKEASNPQKQGSLMNKCYTIYFFICFFSMPIAYYILENFVLKNEANGTPTLLILFIAVFVGLDILYASLMQGRGKYFLTVFFETLIPKAAMLCFVIILLINGSANHIHEWYLWVCLLVYGLIGCTTLFRTFKKIDFSIEKKDLLSITFFFGVTITYSLTGNLTKVLHGFFFNDLSVLGVISVSTSIVTLVNVFTSVLTSLTKPFFAKVSRNNDTGELMGLYRFVTRCNSYIAIPFYLFFITQGEKFLYIFGESYLTYPFIIIILSIAYMFDCLTGPNGTMLSMTGKEKFELVNGVIHLASFVAYCFIFSFNKIYGFSIAFLLSEITVNLVKYIEVSIIYKTNPVNLKSALSILLCFLIDAIFIIPCKFIENIFVWLGVGIVCGLISIILNFIITPYRKHDFPLLTRIYSRK